MKRLRLGATARTLVVLAVMGIATFPVYWMVVTALSSTSDFFADTPRVIPDLTQLGVFIAALTEPAPSGGTPAEWLRTSLIIATSTALLAVGAGLPLGYALSRFSFVGKAIVVAMLLLTQMLPEALLVVPLFSLFRQFDLLNSLHGLILANVAFVLPIVALVLKVGIDNIPEEVEEAGLVDGATAFTLLTRIDLPLIAPSIAATAVISFFHAWNEYVFAVTFIFDRAMQPASVGIANYIGELGTPIQTVMAVAFVFTLPAVVFYLFAQRYVVAGLTSGAVKA